MREFNCNCGGSIVKVAEDRVLHVCKSLFARKQFGDTELEYERVKLNPAVTGGLEKYNWFINWHSSPIAP